MGQRHQLFVIAKVLDRYRSLAAVHHQWLYGFTALRTCRRLAQIFQAPENRHLLKLELARAAALDEKVWAAPVDWNSYPEFPFITTALMLGTALDLDNEQVSSVLAEPWNMPFDGGDNNDGITVLDITTPETIRYSFARFNFLPDDSENSDEDVNFSEDGDADDISNFSARQNLNMVPLTGEEYLSKYCTPDKHTEDMLSVIKELHQVPLIGMEDLRSAWPEGKWVSRTKRGLPDVSNNTSVPTSSGKGSLAKLAMEKTIERLLDDGDDLEADVEQLPSFLPSLRAYLYEKPDVVGKSKFGFKLLQKALSNTKELDLHPFPDLTGEQIVELASTASDDLVLFDVSGNKHITPGDMDSAIKHKRIDELFLWDTVHFPTPADANVISKHSVRSVFHRGLFLESQVELDKLQSIDWGYTRLSMEKPDIPAFAKLEGSIDVPYLIWAQAHNIAFSSDDTQSLAAAFHPDSPLCQNLPRDNSWQAMTGLGQHFRTKRYPLYDVALTPPTILTPLAKLFKLTCSLPQFEFTNEMCSSFVMALPSLLALRDSKSPYKVHPIPPKAFTRAKAAYHSSGESTSVLAKIPITYGKWTAMIIQEHTRNAPEYEAEIVRFRLGFVTATEEGEIRVCDPETFLQETGAADFVEIWKNSVSGLKIGIKGMSRGTKEMRDVEVVGLDLATVQNFNHMMEKIEAAGDPKEASDAPPF
ncbi:hypothetical protein P154DRAFT_619238 [Amniculicola lignicola CBS 123094]|uniref:Uncharacterized protein n=1 Tax=Amniculicola lignicola CBS 123094 TaxID=1392246 RepID=A0A6A5WI87_9PLEO|nr:hypothetical protein P154DRAFT_619238 [Amniculicola lignicola CBS 123094]